MFTRTIIQYLKKNSLSATDFSKFLYKIFKRIEIKEILWLDTIQQEKMHNILPAYNEDNYLPNIYQTKKNQTLNFRVNLPEINLYKFHNIIINTRSSHLISNNHIILERINSADIQYCDYATGLVKFHNHKGAILRRNKNKKHIKKSIFLGGNGSFNYYHWLIEISPKLLLLTNDIIKKHQIEYMIFDSKIRDTPSFQVILNTYLNKLNIDLNILYEDHKTDLYIEELFYINNLNNIVFNSKNILSSSTFSHISKDQIQQTRAFFLQSIPSDLGTYPKKIFLARKAGSVRKYNQQEVLDYFIQQGFSVLYLEEYTFFEQVKIFNDAEFIIGPSGAAWSNIIFCSPHCKGISWLSDQLSEFSIFSTLAQYNHCELRYILTSSDNPNEIHSSYHINLQDLKSIYRSFFT